MADSPMEKDDKSLISNSIVKLLADRRL